MTGFDLPISGVGSNRSANCATTTALCVAHLIIFRQRAVVRLIELWKQRSRVRFQATAKLCKSRSWLRNYVILDLNRVEERVIFLLLFFLILIHHKA